VLDAALVIEFFSLSAYRYRLYLPRKKSTTMWLPCYGVCVPLGTLAALAVSVFLPAAAFGQGEGGGAVTGGPWFWGVLLFLAGVVVALIFLAGGKKGG